MKTSSNPTLGVLTRPSSPRGQKPSVVCRFAGRGRVEEVRKYHPLCWEATQPCALLLPPASHLPQEGPTREHDPHHVSAHAALIACFQFSVPWSWCHLEAEAFGAAAWAAWRQKEAHVHRGAWDLGSPRREHPLSHRCRLMGVTSRREALLTSLQNCAGALHSFQHRPCNGCFPLSSEHPPNVGVLTPA